MVRNEDLHVAELESLIASPQREPHRMIIRKLHNWSDCPGSGLAGYPRVPLLPFACCHAQQAFFPMPQHMHLRASVQSVRAVPEFVVSLGCAKHGRE